MKRMALILFLLTVIMCFCAIPVMAATAEDAGYLSRGELMELLITAADDYHTAAPADIIKGYEDGSLRYDSYATRAEALVMLRRAFTELPALDSNRLYSLLTDKNASFADVPAWAKTDVDMLIASGLLVNTDDGLLHAREYVSEIEVQTLLRRVWMLYGSNHKDDFYMTIEKENIENIKIYPGYVGGSSIHDVGQLENERITMIVDEVLSGNWKTGSDEQKIKDLYQSALAVYSGKSSSLSPIQGYLDELDAADSLDDVLKVIYELNTETGYSTFFEPYIYTDCTDATKNVLWLAPDISPLDATTYGDSDITKAATDYYKALLLLVGDSEEEAAAGAAAMVAYQKDLSKVQVAPENYYDVEYYYNLYSFKDADAQLKNIDLAAYLKIMGYVVPDSLVIQDKGAFTYLCNYLCDENAKSLAYILKCNLLDAYGRSLNNDFFQPYLDFHKALYGESEPLLAKERARNLVINNLSAELGKIYVQKYFTQNDKDRLNEIESNFVDVYRERINALDWMSKETKEKAVAKLDAMTFKNIWPDYWFTDEEAKYLPSYQIASLADGGSLYANLALINRAWTDKNMAMQDQPVDKREWGVSPLEVNAFYDPNGNCVYIMAGLMAGVFYSHDASLETILGSLGMIIGHEMTHAFDSGGAKYDMNGNAANWWTEEDYAAFSDRCQAMEEMFDRFEAAPGIAASGKITLGENIADLGGVTASLEVTKRLVKEPDYQEYFHSFADTWRTLYARQTVSYFTAFEVHSMGWLRVNVPLMQLEQFYETYGITEDDGMYIPPEERVSIW